jgi:hypothetical protein
MAIIKRSAPARAALERVGIMLEPPPTPPPPPKIEVTFDQIEKMGWKEMGEDE